MPSLDVSLCASFVRVVIVGRKGVVTQVTFITIQTTIRSCTCLCLSISSAVASVSQLLLKGVHVESRLL